MRNINITHGFVALGACVLLGLGVAQAQPEAAEPSLGDQFAVAEQTELSPPQMLEASEKTLERMEQGAENIRRQLREARDERDVIKTLCLDDKLSQMDVAKRTVIDRVEGLRAAAQAGNEERARHEYAVVSAIRERAEDLIAEANQCIGEETGFMGESRVTLTVDPNIPDTDTATIPTDPIISQAPVLSSPTF